MGSPAFHHIRRVCFSFIKFLEWAYASQTAARSFRTTIAVFSTFEKRLVQISNAAACNIGFRLILKFYGHILSSSVELIIERGEVRMWAIAVRRLIRV